MGNLLTLTETKGNSSQTITYTYDGRGNVLTEACGNITKTYTYDRAGNLTSSVITDGDNLTEQVTYTYDFLNRLYQVRKGNTLKATYTYDALSRLTLTTYPGNVTESVQYNSAGLPVSVTNAHSGETVSFFTYTYYLDGKQESKTDQTGTTYYEYNERRYLTRTTYPDSSYDAYTYDMYGNRTEKLSVSQEITNNHTIYTYDADDRLTSKQSTVPDHMTQGVLDLLQSINHGGTTYYVTAYTYDNNGNMLSSLYEQNTDDEYEVTQTFDLLNRMVHYENPTCDTAYTYYPDNKRESKSVTSLMQMNPQLPMLPQSQPQSQNTPNIAEVTTHIWLGDEIALDITADDVVKYLHGIKLIESNHGLYLYDAHGSVTEILNSDCEVVTSYTYDPFGADVISTAESIIRDTDMESLRPIAEIQSGMHINHLPVNPYRYCGEYFDSETGYIYLRARYYSPELGRFISSDAAKDGYNWYVYCGNDPVNYVDPSGEMLISMLIIGAAVGAALNVTFNGISNLISGKDFFDNWGFAFLEGALSGALAASGLGLGWQIGLNAVITGGTNALEQLYKGDKFNVGEVAVNAALGAISGAIGGKGAQYCKINVTEIGKRTVKYKYKSTALLLRELAPTALRNSFIKVSAYNISILTYNWFDNRIGGAK